MSNNTIEPSQATNPQLKKNQNQQTEGVAEYLDTTIKEEENHQDCKFDKLQEEKTQDQEKAIVNYAQLEKEHDQIDIKEEFFIFENKKNNSESLILNEQVNEKETNQKQIISDQIQSEKNQKDSDQTPTSKQKLQKKKLERDLRSQSSIGYEKNRKGFDATNRGDIDLALIHKQAKKIKKIDILDLENNELCSCCGLPVDGQKYSLNCDVEEFADFGVGFSFYFIYLKFIMLLLVIAWTPLGMVM